jgi:hypothetical protein
MDDVPFEIGGIGWMGLGAPSGMDSRTLCGQAAHQNVLTMHYRGLVWQIPFFWSIYTRNI